MPKNQLTIENINTPAKLGIALKRLRKLKGLSQGELAKMMNMRQPTISDVENGRGTLDSFFKIVQALKVNCALSSGGVQKSVGAKSKVQEVIDLLYKDEN